MPNKPAVLVVDDDKKVTDDIAEILELSGKYHVLKAYSGKEALETVEHHNKGLLKLDRIKLVLLDIRMPDIDGIETLKKLHEIDENLRAFMVTAYDVDDYWIDSVFVFGAIAYIIKPFKDDDLLAKMENYFKGKAEVLKTQTMCDYIGDRNQEGKSGRSSPNRSLPEG